MFYKKEKIENTFCQWRSEIIHARIGREDDGGIKVRIYAGCCRAAEGMSAKGLQSTILTLSDILSYCQPLGSVVFLA